MREPAGDPARNAAALIESFRDNDRLQRAVVMATASHEYHREDHCPAMAMAMFLAQAFADVAADAEVDLSPMLERWRQVAELMDQAGNADQN